jgi:hypothetical protein
MAMATLTPASNSHLLFVLGGLGKAALSRLPSQHSASALSRLPSHAGAGERGAGVYILLSLLALLVQN